MPKIQSKVQLLIGGAALAAVLTGCGGAVEVDQGPSMSEEKLESLAKTQLENAVGQQAKAMDCPGGVPAAVGAEQRCVLTAMDGSEIGVTATVTSVDGDDMTIDVTVDDEPVG